MRPALAAVALVVAVALAGCASPEEQTAAPEETASETPSETGAASESRTAEASDDPTDNAPDAIEVEIEGDRIEPNGKRVKVAMGEPVRLQVDSDRAAELHIHSSPEHEVALRKGTSTVRFTVDSPGLVDVEEHHTGIVILQLEVS